MIARFTGKSVQFASFFLSFFLLLSGLFGQDEQEEDEQTEEIAIMEMKSQIVPNALRRPERGEAPRYPQDLVIGELGRGRATEEAYLFARNLLSALSRGNEAELTEAAAVLGEGLREEISGIEPRSFRLGGGRTETDGYVSFLVRFMGQEESITGEMFIRRITAPEPPATGETEEPGIAAPASAGEGRWVLDDLVLEEKRNLSEIRDSYRYDFSPYERFY